MKALDVARAVVALVRDVLLIVVLAGGIYVFAQLGEEGAPEPEDCTVTARYYGRC